MSEHDDAIRLANKILDRVSADPDDDLAVIARQFLRSEDRVSALMEEHQWQPIKTAPRTGEEIIAMRPDGQRVIVHWSVSGFRLTPDGPWLELTRWCAIPPNLANAK